MRTIFGRNTGPAIHNLYFCSLGLNHSAPETSIFINTTGLQSPETSNRKCGITISSSELFRLGSNPQECLCCIGLAKMSGVTADVFTADIPSRLHLHLHIQSPRTEGMSPWTNSLLPWRFIHSLIVFTFLQRCLFWVKGWMSSCMDPKTLTKCTSSIIVIDFASVVPSIEAHLVYTSYVKFLPARWSSLIGRRHFHFKWSSNIHIEIKIQEIGECLD
jgi:hypothetical protein